jgi:hypothetical protein
LLYLWWILIMDHGIDRFYMSWSQSTKKAFTKSCTKWVDDLGKKEIEKDLNQVSIQFMSLHI